MKQQTLATLVKQVKKGQLAFLDICRALHVIESEKLYKQKTGSFVRFCKDEFEMTSSEVSRYRAAAGVLNDLDSHLVPVNEGQCRELAKLKSAARRKQVWAEVLERHSSGERITAALIREVAGISSETSEAGQPRRRSLMRLSDIESEFDRNRTDDDSANEFLRGLAYCMGVTLKQATKESDKRIEQAAEAA